MKSWACGAKDAQQQRLNNTYLPFREFPMKICRFNHDRVGIVVDDDVYDITERFNLSTQWPVPLGDMVVSQLNTLLPSLSAELRAGMFAKTALKQVTLDSPVANPSKIIGAPINYHAHIQEANADQAINHGKTYTSLEQYGLFLKSNSCLIGPSDQVTLRFPERRNDHEVELAVVIGRRGSHISEDEALEYVLGYSIGLDMTVRGPEFPGFRKSPDTYGVLGPWIVTRDEIDDPNALDLSLHVNGEKKQDSNTTKLIFNVQQLIAYASKFYTLYPGDVIMTGTPEGVSTVKAGDVMSAHIERIGDITIPIGIEKN